MRLIHNRRSVVSTYGMLLAGSIVLAFSSVTPAAADQPQSGITISPYMEQLTLNKNQTSAGYTITVTNNSASLVIIHLRTVDFSNLNDHGEIVFLTPKQSKHDPYSLINNVSFPYPEVVLGAHQGEAVPIQISNANQLASGGHFGAVLFSINNPEPGNGPTVTVNQDSASLLFVSTNGAGTEALNLSTPLINNFYASLPTTIDTVFTNTGNTQTIPYGLAQITNDQGTVVAQGQLNTDSSLILPESKRLFTTYLRPTTNHLPPGQYHLVLKYRTNRQTDFTTYTQSFEMINQSYILTTLAILLVLFILAKYHREWLPNRLFKRHPKTKQIPAKLPKKRTIAVAYEDEEAVKIR